MVFQIRILSMKMLLKKAASPQREKPSEPSVRLRNMNRHGKGLQGFVKRKRLAKGNVGFIQTDRKWGIRKLTEKLSILSSRKKKGKIPEVMVDNW